MSASDGWGLRVGRGPQLTVAHPRGPNPADLLSWRDEGIDVLQHRLQGAVIAHTQVLNLDLPLVWPVLGDQR